MLETFEVHITGSENIHKVGEVLLYKTIAIDLLRPDQSVLRTEHMTSMVVKQPSFESCQTAVLQMVENLRAGGVDIIRVKIECPFYPHYVPISKYLESHYESGLFVHPTSRNQNKSTLLATDRVWDHDHYEGFRQSYVNHMVELCLYDTYANEDDDWFSLYAMKAAELCAT
jgi:hypothetical protein